MSAVGQQIIGGTFGLTDLSAHGGRPLPSLNRPGLLTVNARSAMWLLIQALRPRVVWMPSFLCDAMLQAVQPPGRTTVRFYAVDDRLALRQRAGDDPPWLREVAADDLVVLIDFFGFPCDPHVLRAARQRGARVLEDASQAMCSLAVGREADYVVFSPRKFLGVPDGGILVCNGHMVDGPPEWQHPPPQWWLGSLESLIGRRAFDERGGGGAADRRWFEQFQRAEAAAPVGPIAMSDLTAAVLRCAVPFDAIVQRRQSNYRVLLDELGDLALLPVDPPDGVAPLGFPVCHPDRDRVRQALFARQIFPPVHWDVRGFVPSEFADSHRLSAQIMTLPCDQRYDVADMRRMARCLREVL